MIFQNTFFDLKWFTTSTLTSFEWLHPIAFYCIPLILVCFLMQWIFSLKRKVRMPIATRTALSKFDPWTLLRFIPFILLFLAWTCFMLALARPQSSDEIVETHNEGIDILITLDISQSMTLKDFRPNRLEAAKKTAKNFIKGRTNDKIGMVIFSGDAYTLSPLTTDYKLLDRYLKEVNIEMIKEQGTAIGSALATSINRLRDSKAKSKVIILISDGDNNAGEIDPISAAELARAYDIKIYTISIGKLGKVLYGKDLYGRDQYVENWVDRESLKKISTISNGKFFEASNNSALIQVFSSIDKLEKYKIEETKYYNTFDFYQYYLFWGIFFLIIWMFTKMTFIDNLLID